MVYTTHKNGDALGMVYGIVLTTLEMIKQYQVCKFNMFLNSPPVSWNMTVRRIPHSVWWFPSKFDEHLHLYWLVVWNMNFIFPYIGKNHPNWLIFFRGVGIPPTSIGQGFPIHLWLPEG